jgi:hypothetical protein
MTMQTDAQDTLDRLKAAQQKPLGDPRFKSLIWLEKSTFSQNASATSGLTFYDLELGAKFLYPVLTPLRNMIPRVSGKGGIQAAWRAITAINTTGLRFGVSAANRGGVMAVKTQVYTATYKGIGVETSVDFEAQYAGQEFDDVRAIGAKTGLEALMLGEEAMILGGCTSTLLGTTPTPTPPAMLPFIRPSRVIAAQMTDQVCAVRVPPVVNAASGSRTNLPCGRRLIIRHLRRRCGKKERERNCRYDWNDWIYHCERYAGRWCVRICLVLGSRWFRSSRRDYDD